jgi:hypothetical protein
VESFVPLCLRGKNLFSNTTSLGSYERHSSTRNLVEGSIASAHWIAAEAGSQVPNDAFGRNACPIDARTPPHHFRICDDGDAVHQLTSDHGILPKAPCMSSKHSGKPLSGQLIRIFFSEEKKQKTFIPALAEKSRP